MKDLMIFSAGAAEVPAHIAGFLEEAGTNIADRTRVPTLNYGGKVWSIALPDGSKTNLTRKNEDGDVELLQTIRVVVLDYAKQRGRTYYEGAFDPERIAAPDCWSDDGVHPDPAVQAPKAANCAACPLSVKGSKITEAGKSVPACSQHRHVAVMLLGGGMALPPVRMKLAITSLFDKQSPELEKEGWRAFENYMDFLRGNGVKHTAALVTKMRFDPNVNYPKVIFSSERWLEPAEMDVVKARMADGSVEALLKMEAPESAAEAPALPAPVVTPPAPVVRPPAPAAREPKAAPKSAVTQELLDLAKAAHAPKPEPAPPAVAIPEPAPETPPTVSTDIPKDLQDLLADWED